MVDEVWLRNGLQYYSSKGKYLYNSYARIKELRVVFEYAERENEVLAFALPDDVNTSWLVIDTGHHEDVYAVTIYIDAIYKGKDKANTLCVTDLMLVKLIPTENGV